MVVYKQVDCPIGEGERKLPLYEYFCEKCGTKLTRIVEITVATRNGKINHHFFCNISCAYEWLRHNNEKLRETAEYLWLPILYSADLNEFFVMMDW